MQIPMNLQLRPDGKVDFQSATLTLNELKPKLKEIAHATPAQPLVIKGRENVTATQLKKVLAVCKLAKLKNVTVAKAWPQDALVASNGLSSASMPSPTPATASSAAANQPDAAKPKVNVTPVQAARPDDYSAEDTHFTIP